MSSCFQLAYIYPEATLKETLRKKNMFRLRNMITLFWEKYDLFIHSNQDKYSKLNLSNFGNN